MWVRQPAMARSRRTSSRPEALTNPAPRALSRRAVGHPQNLSALALTVKPKANPHWFSELVPSVPNGAEIRAKIWSWTKSPRSSGAPRVASPATCRLKPSFPRVVVGASRGCKTAIGGRVQPQCWLFRPAISEAGGAASQRAFWLLGSMMNPEARITT